MTHHLRFILRGSRSLHALLVRGEVADLSVLPSGRVFFSLRDPEARVRCVMFAREAHDMAFHLEEGLEVTVEADVDVYPSKGYYELVVHRIEPWGPGAYRLAYLQIRKRLETEGLLDGGVKRPLPTLPRRVGLVTSEQGAVLEDMVAILGHRYPLATLIVAPATVQGPGAAPSLIAALRRLADHGAVDLIILARGGGSADDLWPFNDEGLARTIRSSLPPVVSAVGHEGDWTIADLVADARAPTPSAAAALVGFDVANLAEEVLDLGARLRRTLEVLVRDFDRELLTLRQILPKSLEAPLEAAHEVLTHLGQSLAGAVEELLEKANAAAEGEVNILKAAGPPAVLLRGFALVEGAQGAVSEASQVAVGDDVRVVFAQGWLRCRVVERG